MENISKAIINFVLCLSMVAILLSCSATEEPTVMESNRKLVVKIDKSKFSENNPIVLDSLIRQTSHENSH